jgi:DNA-binding MarR family transcriptional regulator
VPLMSRSMLSRRLQELEHEGIIERTPNETGRGCTYQLTPAGHAFLPIVEALGEWGRQWSRRDLAANEVDVSQLLWSMERSVRPDAFGDRRTVMQLEFTDQIGNRRRWWFVNETSEAQLCVKDPGFDIDLYLSVRLRDMIRIWRGDLSLAHAVDSGQLKINGPSELKRAVPAWLDVALPRGARGSP